MTIYWNKIVEDVVKTVKEMLVVLLYIILGGLLIGLSPLLFPISAFIVFFQDRYTDTEPNEYLKVYLGICLAFIAGSVVE